jgi:hypothetical protein
MNHSCYKCKKEYHLFDFINNEFFCETCKLYLNNCEVITDLKDCNIIFDNYQWMKEVPKIGAYGFLYIVYNKNINKETFLKVQRYYGSNREMQISCLVSKYPNFVKTYNGWICDEEPVEDIWKKSRLSKELLKSSNPNERTLLSFIEMEKYNGSFNDLFFNGTQLTFNDKVSVCFELFYSMKIAYDELGFIHNDIHYGNIFYQYNNKPRNYDIETRNESDKRITLNINCSSIFFPIWGDFGRSFVLKGEYKSNDDFTDDEKDFQTKIFKMMENGFTNYDDNINKLGRDLMKNKKTNQQVLELLGKMVIESQEISNKKQRLKSKIK